MSLFLPGESSSGEERPYPPTARRLERARASGGGPHSPALAGAGAVVVAVFMGAVGWAVGRAMFARSLARACSLAAEGRFEPQTLSWVALTALATAAVAIFAAAALVADVAIAGAGWAGFGRRRRRAGGGLWRGLRATAVPLVGLCGAAVGVRAVLRQCAGASLTQVGGVLGVAVAGAVAAVAVAALADVAWAWAQFIAGAWMSRRQVLEEAREMRGPQVWRVKRQRIFRERMRR